MIAKKKELQSEIKQKIKSKASKLESHISKPLPAQKNKTSTQNPSYIRPKKQTYLDMRQNLHQIINKASFMSLRRQVKTATFKATQEEQKPKSNKLNPKQMLNNVVGKQHTYESNNVRVMGCLPNQNSLAQLWALVPDELHDETFYIYHIQSNLALKIQNDKVTLAPKQKTKEFMFYIPKDTDKTKSFSIYKDYVNIISSLNGKALSLKGILQLSETNMKDQCQQFYFKKINLYQPKPLKESYILFNPQDKDKQKAFLSVTKDKQQICYQRLDYSLYQRWIFSPPLNSLDKKCNAEHNVDRIKEDDIPKKSQSKNTTLVERKSKLQELNEAQISLITTAAKNLVEEYDNNCCEILNFKLEKSLVVRQQKGLNKLVFVPKAEKKEWKMQCDGFSIKIKHEKTNQYLGVRDEKVVLTKDPQYWQVFQSSKNMVQANSRMGPLRGSMDYSNQSYV